MAPSRIAVVGVGNMGSRMARRLIDAGHSVTVTDPDSDAVRALEDVGATAAASAGDASAAADVIITSLPRPAILAAVIDEIIAGAGSGTVILDASTVDPTTARSAADRLEGAGMHFLDIPVSGGTAGAASGNLVIMAGGPVDVLDRVRPVLEALSQKIVHCGDVGTGQLTKLAHNLVTAINTAALGEVLTASVAAGADLKILTEVLSAGLAGSKMLDYLPQTLFTEERPANFALDLMRKDIGLALQEFGERPMYLGQVTRQLYNTASAAGHGREDSTGVAAISEASNEVRLAL